MSENPSLEEQFAHAFMDIQLGDSGQHLLESESVTNCTVNGEHATITLKLPPDEKLRASVTEAIEKRVAKIPGITKIKFKMYGEDDGEDADGHHHHHDHGAGPGEPRPPQRAERKTYLQEYDAVVVVASGKGGVGKSTVAVNLAVTLLKMGNKVSLFDADIYGPSIPIMTGMRGARTKMENDKILPLQRLGLDLLSVGNLVEEAAATVWRGPIVHQVIEQLLRDTKWPGGDFMIIDLPPGTGDAHLTISQLLEVAGAVIVSTPQDVALLDALKAVDMFSTVDIPVLGLVENMSTFICPSCKAETPIFDTGNAEKAGVKQGIAFLGNIPIELDIRVGGDNGVPVAAGEVETPSILAFKKIAEGVIAQLAKSRAG